MNVETRSRANQQLRTELAAWQASTLQHTKFAAELNAAHEQDLRLWEARRIDFDAKRDEQHSQVDLQRSSYLAGDLDAVVSYLEEVLSSSDYPDDFPKEHQLSYIPNTKTLIVDYEMPNQGFPPRIGSGSKATASTPPSRLACVIFTSPPPLLNSFSNTSRIKFSKSSQQKSIWPARNESPQRRESNFRVATTGATKFSQSLKKRIEQAVVSGNHKTHEVRQPYQH